MRNMAMVKEFKRKHYSWDEYCYRKSKEFMKDISRVEMELHKIYNLIKCRKLKRAEKFLQILEENYDVESDNDHKAYFLYLKAKIEFYKDNKEAAWEIYEEIIDLPKKEKYLSAFSKYRLLLLKIKDMENYGDDYHEVDSEDLKYVKNTVKSISKMSGYDFEKPLTRKLERVKDYFKEEYGLKF